jgi:hypothetical protein
MRPIRNIDNHDLKVDFDFNTYFLPKNRTVMVEEDLFNHLKEILPLSFSFDVEVGSKGKPLPMVKRTKTKSFFPTDEKRKTNDDMYIENPNPKATFGGADLTPDSGTTDKDGVTWYGEGITIEGGKND